MLLSLFSLFKLQRTVTFVDVKESHRTFPIYIIKSICLCISTNTSTFYINAQTYNTPIYYGNRTSSLFGAYCIYAFGTYWLFDNWCLPFLVFWKKLWTRAETNEMKTIIWIYRIVTEDQSMHTFMPFIVAVYLSVHLLIELYFEHL